MRMIHTSDWHLGHSLHDVDREPEHLAFLNWLVEEIQTRSVDALLIAGDIFDTSNPSASSQEMWFGFLARALKARPNLQIVAIAGNHDSAARLEATDPLLRQFDIRVVGSVSYQEDGRLDPSELLVTLKDAKGNPGAVVIAIPFLRPGDLPAIEFVEEVDPLIEGVRTMYGEMVVAAREQNLPVLAMGHCYLVQGQLSELSERKILGGNQHALPASIFPADVSYVALGHLHLSQTLDNGRVRYSGSPIPLSMSERHYPHAVTVLELDATGTLHLEQLRIPRTRDLIRVPDSGFLSLPDALEALGSLENRTDEVKPLLEVGISMEKPQAMLRNALLETLNGKGYHLAKITAQYTGSGQVLGDHTTIHGLKDLSIEEVFLKKWSQRHKEAPAPEYLAAFHELHDLVLQQEVAR